MATPVPQPVMMQPMPPMQPAYAMPGQPVYMQQAPPPGYVYAYYPYQPGGYVAPPPSQQFIQFVQQHPDGQKLERAATAIQKVWRGHEARKEVAPPRNGTIMLQVHHAVNLYNTNCCCAMDPYCKISYGKQLFVTKVCSSGGVKPKWTDSPFFFCQDPKLEAVKVEVKNHNFFCDDHVSDCLVECKPMYEKQDEKVAPSNIELGQHRGILTVSACFIPSLVVTVHECENLYDVQIIGKQDPFVKLYFVPNTAVVGLNKRVSKTCRDGHKSPQWHESFTFLMTRQWHLEQPVDEKQAAAGAAAAAAPAAPAAPAAAQSKPAAVAPSPPGDGPTLVMEIINENHLKNDDIAYVALPWNLILQTFKRGPCWSELTRGSYGSKGQKIPGGRIAWEVKMG